MIIRRGGLELDRSTGVLLSSILYLQYLFIVLNLIRTLYIEFWNSLIPIPTCCTWQC